MIERATVKFSYGRAGLAIVPVEDVLVSPAIGCASRCGVLALRRTRIRKALAPEHAGYF
jgi:hypothetical protein